MNNVDENTRVAIEIVSSGIRLSGELLAGALKSASALLKGKDISPYKGAHHKNNTKSGKQNIKDLVNKHQGGINALDDNITKEQVKDYSKELKRLGVDFSVKKNGKDNYSFFFASKDNAVMEKALKNIIERKDKKISKQEEKEGSKKGEEISDNRNAMETKKVVPFQSTKEEVKTTDKRADLTKPKYQKINTLTKKSILKDIQKELSQKEFQLFTQRNKMELERAEGNGYTRELKKYETEFKKLSPEGLAKVNRLYDNFVYTGQDKLPENKVHFQEVQTLLTEIRNDDQITKDSVLEKLTSKEQKLFYQLAEKRSESLSNSLENKNDLVEFNKYNELKKDFSQKEIEKVESLFDRNVFSGIGKKPKNQLSLNDVTNKTNKEKKAENNRSEEKNKNPYCMENVKKLDQKIKEAGKEQAKDKHKKQDISLWTEAVKEVDMDNDGVPDRIDINDHDSTVQTVADLNKKNNSKNSTWEI